MTTLDTTTVVDMWGEGGNMVGMNETYITEEVIMSIDYEQRIRAAQIRWAGLEADDELLMVPGLVLNEQRLVELVEQNESISISEELFGDNDNYQHYSDSEREAADAELMRQKWELTGGRDYGEIVDDPEFADADMDWIKSELDRIENEREALLLG